MFTNISLMIQAICRAVTKLAGAAEKGASAVDHLAGWADDTAAAFADQARVDREARLEILNAQLAKQKAALAAGNVPAAPASMVP